MVSSILTIVLLVLLVLIGLLAIPISFTHHLSWQQGLQGELTLRWLFGLVRVHFSPSRSGAKESGELEQAAVKVKTASRKKRASTSKNRNILATIRQKAFRRRILRFIKDLWRAVHKENIRLRVSLGLGDPADTGQLWAIMGPVAGILATAKGASIEIVPDFLESNLEVNSSGTIRLIPLQIIGLTLGFILSPTILKGIKQMRSA